MVAILSRTYSNSEYDFGECDLALTELTDELLKKILVRRKLFLELKQKDSELQDMFFWDSSTAYLNSAEFPITDMQSQTLFDGDELFEFKGDLKETEKFWQRTELDRMVIQEEGVLWSCTPKHTDVFITTPLIPFNKIEEWIGKEKSNG